MRSKFVIVAALLALTVAGLGLTACGGGSGDTTSKQEMEAMRKKRAAMQRKNAQKKQATGMQTIKFVNPAWDTLRPYFNKYVAQKHTTPKNIMVPRTDRFIPRPALPDEDEAPEETAANEELPEDERGPLQQDPIKDYRLLMIMSGTADPKAVVVDKKGNAFVVEVDTRIGNKGGVVRAITQYAVMVQEPDSDKPEKLNIKPPFLDLVSQARAAGDLGREDEDVLPPDFLPPLPGYPGAPAAGGVPGRAPLSPEAMRP